MKKVLIIAAILVGLAVVAVVGIGGLTALYLFTTEDLPVSSVDEGLVVSASDLVPYYDDYFPSEAYESIEKLRYVDDSEELAYEYDSPLDDEPYISVTVTWEKTRQDANVSYGLGWSASVLGMNIADSAIDVEEDNGYYTVGDRSRLGNLEYDGDPVGHILVAQKGNSIYTFMISGFLVDDPELWHELFDERIAALSDLK